MINKMMGKLNMTPNVHINVPTNLSRGSNSREQTLPTTYNNITKNGDVDGSRS